MHYIHPNTGNLSLNFRQWSRKGYAVFASLGKNVRIAVLKLAVSDTLSCKNHKAFAVIENHSASDEIDCVDETQDEPVEELLLEPSFLFIPLTGTLAACDIDVTIFKNMMKTLLANADRVFCFLFCRILMN